MEKFDLKAAKIAVIGLGYVGLPLSIEFGKKYKVLGFDINKERIDDLLRGKDSTGEANIDELKKVLSEDGQTGLHFSSSIEDLRFSNIFIITVPTPVDHFKSPDLKPLLYASEIIGSVIKKNDIVIYESTVYPGCTEEDCVPVLEEQSKLKFPGKNKPGGQGKHPNQNNKSYIGLDPGRCRFY